jgi:hypothetical protein
VEGEQASVRQLAAVEPQRLPRLSVTVREGTTISARAGQTEIGEFR